MNPAGRGPRAQGVDQHLLDLTRRDPRALVTDPVAAPVHATQLAAGVVRSAASRSF